VETQISHKYLEAHANNYKKIASRMEEIKKTGEWFEQVVKESFPECELVYSPNRLESSISSYFYDIFRYKEFHGMLDEGNISKINYPKIFSFTIKWIVRDKPFYIDTDGTNIENIYSSEQAKKFFKISNSINELILLFWINDTHKHHSGSTLLDSNDFTSLIYNFRYREINTGILELFFEKICDPKLISKGFDC